MQLYVKQLNWRLCQKTLEEAVFGFLYIEASVLPPSLTAQFLMQDQFSVVLSVFDIKKGTSLVSVGLYFVQSLGVFKILCT